MKVRGFAIFNQGDFFWAQGRLAFIDEGGGVIFLGFGGFLKLSPTFYNLGALFYHDHTFFLIQVLFKGFY